MQECGTLVFYCGKMAAGKSTKSKIYAEDHRAVLVSEDEWLKALYPDQIKSVQDYLKYSALLKPVLHSHVQNILQSGTTVVMDFPANTRDQRQWFLDIAQQASAPHLMFFLHLSDEQCLAQLAQRRLESPERAHFDTPETFQLISGFFELPGQHEMLNMEVLSA